MSMWRRAGRWCVSECLEGLVELVCRGVLGVGFYRYVEGEFWFLRL